MLNYQSLCKNKNLILKNIYFHASLEQLAEIHSHFGTDYRNRKVTVDRIPKVQADQFKQKFVWEQCYIIVYLGIHLERKLISQEDKIIQLCRQLPPKGRNDLQQGKNEECSFYVFYQLCGTEWKFLWEEKFKNIFMCSCYLKKQSTCIMIIIFFALQMTGEVLKLIINFWIS